MDALIQVGDYYVNVDTIWWADLRTVVDAEGVPGPRVAVHFGAGEPSSAAGPLVVCGDLGTQLWASLQAASDVLTPFGDSLLVGLASMWWAEQEADVAADGSPVERIRIHYGPWPPGNQGTPLVVESSPDPGPAAAILRKHVRGPRRKGDAPRKDL